MSDADAKLDEAIALYPDKKWKPEEIVEFTGLPYGVVNRSFYAGLRAFQNSPAILAALRDLKDER